MKKNVALSTFNVLSICSGIGGLELGLKLAVRSSRTVCYCEREAYCAEVLVKRIHEGILDNAPVWSDIASFNGKPWSGKVDCIIGGYPCQPFSSIGKKLGLRDKRWLWPQIARIVGEIGPEWCFFENVSKHLRMGFKQVHKSLRQMGYRVAAGVFTAEEVGAMHERERLFVLAHSDRRRRRAGSLQGVDAEVDAAPHQMEGEERELAHALDDGGADVAGRSIPYQAHQLELGFPPGPDSDGWRQIDPGLQPVEPGVFRVADGIAARVDRLRCCGNAVVPLVAAYAFHVLAQALGE